MKRTITLALTASLLGAACGGVVLTPGEDGGSQLHASREAWQDTEIVNYTFRYEFQVEQSAAFRAEIGVTQSEVVAAVVDGGGPTPLEALPTFEHLFDRIDACEQSPDCNVAVDYAPEGYPLRADFFRSEMPKLV